MPARGGRPFKVTRAALPVPRRPEVVHASPPPPRAAQANMTKEQRDLKGAKNKRRREAYAKARAEVNMARFVAQESFNARLAEKEVAAVAANAAKNLQQRQQPE